MRNYLKRKETAFRQCLGNEQGGVVLSDLRSFCNGTKSNFSEDALQMARMEGRREVFMRIMNFMNVDYSEYYTYEEGDYLDD